MRRPPLQALPWWTLLPSPEKIPAVANATSQSCLSYGLFNPIHTSESTRLDSHNMQVDINPN